MKRGRGRFCSVSCRNIGTALSKRNRSYRIVGESVFLPVGGGRETIIDLKILPLLVKYPSWHATSSRGKEYAEFSSKKNGKTFTLKLHRVVLGLKKTGPQVDHINGNTLDNRKSNLRICNAAQNGWNRGPAKTNTSGYKGVSFCKRSNKWLATIRRFGRRRHLGYFSSVEMAHEAYTAFARKHDGEFFWEAWRSARDAKPKEGG